MKKYWIQIVVLLLAVLLISQLNISEYTRSMSELRPSIWINLIALQMFSFLLLLIQWKRISAALGKDVSYRQMVSVNMRGIFYETITPGLKVGGELAKGLSLVNEMGFTSGEASALVVIQKSISIFALVFLSILSFMFLNTELQLTQTTLFFTYAVLVGVLLLLVLVLFLPEKLYTFLNKSSSQGKIRIKIKNFLEKYIEAFNQIKKNKKEVFYQLLLSFVVWTLFPFKLYYIVNSLGLELSFIRAFAVTIVSYLAGMVPLLPGGLGSFEASMMGLFLLWGINKEQGLVIATLFRFTTFWLLFFVSIVYLAGKRAGHRLKGA